MSQPRTIPPTTAAALDTWAAQKRRLFLEHSEPVACTLGRLKSERVAAGEGDPKIRQKWPEVYSGDGLAVHTIVCRFQELPRLVLVYYWVLKFPWRVPVREQCEDIGISRSEYWRQLDRAEFAVSIGLEVLSEPWRALGLATQGNLRVTA